MATNKSSTKKSSVTKKRPASKTAASKKQKQLSLRSHVGLRKEESAFMTFRITKQSLYWLVLGAIVIVFTIWLMQLQSDIQSLYDEIDMNTMETPAL